MLSRKNRLTKRGSFTYVYKKGTIYNGKLLRLLFVPFVGSSNAQALKVGFSVCNKLGKAVVRNKIKRRLRAAVRQLMINTIKSCQMVIVAKESIINVGYDEILSELSYLLSKSGLAPKK